MRDVALAIPRGDGPRDVRPGPPRPTLDQHQRFLLAGVLLHRAGVDDPEGMLYMALDLDPIFGVERVIACIRLRCKREQQAAELRAARETIDELSERLARYER